MFWSAFPLLFVLFMLVLAGWLWLSANQEQDEAGLPPGNIIYTDTGTWFPNNDTLTAPDVRLVGKPDYLVEEADGMIVPVELKSGRAPEVPWDSHVLQLAAYCFLVEANYGVRPVYGILQYRDKAFAIDYTDELEDDLLDLLAEMRQNMSANDVGRSHNDWTKCSKCSVNRQCYERLA